MADLKRNTYGFEPLGGSINQRTKGTQLPAREAKLLYNITHDKIGVWRTRKGGSLIATTISGTSGMQGLMAYKKALTNGLLVGVVGRNLYIWDGTGTFNQLGSSTLFDNGVKVHGVNFLNRLYLFSEGVNDKLRYTDGNTIVTVGGATSSKQVTAKYGATAQSTLWIAGVLNQPDRVYASRFDESTVTPTDEFYETSEDFAGSTRFFIMDGEITGMKAFKDFSYVFTRNTVTRVDVLDIGTLRGATKVLDVGTTSHRSIAVDTKFGVMLWTDGRSGVYLWTGAGDSINVAERIIDRSSGMGVMDLIASTKFGDLAAIAHDGKYYLALGDLTDATLEYASKAGLVYDIAANKWTLRELDASILTEFRGQDNEKSVYVGSTSTRSVYKLETGTTDDDSSGDAGVYKAYIHTKDFCGEFGPGRFMKTFHSITVTYSGQSVIEVSFSINGDSKYTAIPQGMIVPESTTKDRVDAFIPLPKNTRGKSISFEFRRPTTYKKDGKIINNLGEMEIIALDVDVTTFYTSGRRSN